MKQAAYTVKLSKTLYQNTYRCTLSNENEEVIGNLRVVPGLPLDRSEVPENAPTVPPYLLVIVDDADINKDNLIDFEERTSYALLKRFSTEYFVPQHCHDRHAVVPNVQPVVCALRYCRYRGCRWDLPAPACNGLRR